MRQPIKDINVGNWQGKRLRGELRFNIDFIYVVVNVFAVADLYHQKQQFILTKSIDHPVISRPDSS